MKHTQGQWVITSVNPNTTKIGHGFETIATITHPHWDEQTKANSRLIASAPDLLEALETVDNLLATRFWLAGGSEIDWHRVRQDIQQAIAKARGEK